MRLTKTYKYLNQTTINYINGLVEDMTDFDELEFMNWLEDKDIPGKSSPSNYLRSCFRSELEKGTFSRKKHNIQYEPETVLLFNLLRELGVVLPQMATSDISVASSYLVRNGYLTKEEMENLNITIAYYLADNKETMTADNFVELIKKSNALKNKGVNWEELDNEMEQERNEWIALLEQFTKEEESL